MLVYTLPELAKEFRTSKENIYILEKLGEIRAICFSTNKVVSVFEAERFLVDNAGKSFDGIIDDAKKRNHLADLDRKVISMQKEEGA